MSSLFNSFPIKLDANNLPGLLNDGMKQFGLKMPGYGHT
jgi:hypothetical protein